LLPFAMCCWRWIDWLVGGFDHQHHTIYTYNKH
jgi:hypothetical protein